MLVQNFFFTQVLATEYLHVYTYTYVYTTHKHALQTTNTPEHTGVHTCNMPMMRLHLHLSTQVRTALA